MTAINITHLRDWIGRREEATDLVSSAHVARMAAMLDLDPPAAGANLPPLWHWLFFAPTAPQSQIGADGHPLRGGFLPPVSLPRRMWAGGRLRFHTEIPLDSRLRRESEIAAVEHKSGSQGELVFLTLHHRYYSGDTLAVAEEQDIVYRDHGKTALPSPLATTLPQADWRHPLRPDPVLLFRFSALTFNAHRIHYDLPYATGGEGYPGLVVQGPLTATLLLGAWQRETGRRPDSFEFRGRAPLFAGHEMAICGEAAASGHALWAEGPGGYLAMTARVTG